jgi:hypothetical protein
MGGMEEIFKLEYHPQGGQPRRVRFLVEPGSEVIERVVECRENGAWKRHHAEHVDYLAYSDE